LHSILRWLLLILLVASIIKSFNGWQSKKVFTAGDRKLFLFTLITTHINFLVGLYLLFFGRFGIISAGKPDGVDVMKDKFFRFFWVEHPVGMLIAIVLITLGNAMAKKIVSDTTKFKKAFWFFFIALIIILATVPWPFREIGRPWI
ncbi:MAG TPA: hypothetical protein VHZ50_11920, partial [Puia sp.]|nr:hypothetical protein [Puia sp.]